MASSLAEPSWTKAMTQDGRCPVCPLRSAKAHQGAQAWDTDFRNPSGEAKNEQGTRARQHEVPASCLVHR